MYGDTIRVRYFDAAEPAVRAEHHDLLTDLREQRLPLPAVFLDGRLLVAGAIDPLRVVVAVAEARRRQSTGM